MIREKELLFGPQSLLARYGPLLVEICSKPEVYKVEDLRAAADDVGQWVANSRHTRSREIYVCILYGLCLRRC